jgi:hypothetical protein
MFLFDIKNKCKGLPEARAWEFLPWGGDLFGLTYSFIVCFFKMFMRSLRSVLVAFGSSQTAQPSLSSFKNKQLRKRN